MIFKHISRTYVHSDYQSEHIMFNFRKVELYFLYLIATILIYFSTFHPLDMVSDAFEYKRLIDNYEGFIKSIEENPSAEISFWLILSLNSLAGNTVEGVFLIYSFLSIFILIKAIQKLSISPLLSMFIFIFIYYILYSLTYIRFGVSLSIFLLALYDLSNGNNKKYFIKILFASFFHYSFFPLLLLGFIKNIPNQKYGISYFLLPILGYLIYIFFPNIFVESMLFINNLSPNFIQYKIYLYLTNINLEKDQGYLITHFLIVKILVYYLYLLFPYSVSNSDKLLVKLLGWSIFLHFFLFMIPQFSVRYVAIFSIGIIVLFVNIVNINKDLRILFIILFCYSYYLFVRSFGIIIFI